MVGVNFGKTTIAKDKEEFDELVKERKLKNPDEVNEKIVSMLKEKENIKKEL